MDWRWNWDDIWHGCSKIAATKCSGNGWERRLICLDMFLDSPLLGSLVFESWVPWAFTYLHKNMSDYKKTNNRVINRSSQDESFFWIGSFSSRDSFWAGLEKPLKTWRETRRSWNREENVLFRGLNEKNQGKQPSVWETYSWKFSFCSFVWGWKRNFKFPLPSPLEFDWVSLVRIGLPRRNVLPPRIVLLRCIVLQPSIVLPGGGVCFLFHEFCLRIEWMNELEFGVTPTQQMMNGIDTWHCEIKFDSIVWISEPCLAKVGQLGGSSCRNCCFPPWSKLCCTFLMRLLMALNYWIRTGILVGENDKVRHIANQQPIS